MKIVESDKKKRRKKILFENEKKGGRNLETVFDSLKTIAILDVCNEHLEIKTIENLQPLLL